MRLIEVQVDHFRNIINSSPVDIDPYITCLVGKNESGKTAFLHALNRLLPARGKVNFSIPENYPAWLEKRDRLQGVNLGLLKPIQAKFLLDANEKNIVDTAYGKGSLMSDLIILSRDYNDTLFHDIQVDENVTIKHLLSKFDLPQKLKTEAGALRTLQEFNDFIARAQTRENVSEDDKAKLAQLQKSQLAGIISKGLSEAIWEKLKDFVPQFLYFDKYSALPYSVDINKILNTPEKQLDDSELTARSLLRLAAADNDYLVNPDYERRKRELENVANALTEDVIKYWSQNPHLRVTPDITLKTVNNQQGQHSVINELKLRIWDERHLLSLPLSEHSSGFQWFFSFLAAFSEFENRNTPLIILLDEPALGLHARAQKDFLRFIEERLALKCQVIYTTHSPFMVQPNMLNRVRIVEDRGREEGTKISSEVLSTDPDTIFPLQGALGYDIAQHLFISPHNLVVEGTSDFLYLQILSDYLKSQERTHLDEKWSIIPVGGADLIPTFVALLGNHLDVTVLVDSQKSGHQRLLSMSTQGFLSQTRIIMVGEILGTRLADIEDIFGISDYLLLYNQAYSDNVQESDLVGSDPITMKIARLKNVSRFDHGKPADVLLRDKEKLLSIFSVQTLENFERLFARINSTLGI